MRRARRVRSLWCAQRAHARTSCGACWGRIPTSSRSVVHPKHTATLVYLAENGGGVVQGGVPPPAGDDHARSSSAHVAHVASAMSRKVHGRNRRSVAAAQIITPGVARTEPMPTTAQLDELRKKASEGDAAAVAFLETLQLGEGYKNTRTAEVIQRCGQFREVAGRRRREQHARTASSRLQSEVADDLRQGRTTRHSRVWR
eukprot:TRINITY_DN682_c1_g1_i11.p1 TRINITY_DN682_c1_g1~~TRINITY_DN682_c1_g1_i11.p1  ORF type:complete len:201 (-),score=3.01 TRINITY_DN682_c1_g1_i11:779-1381(-)